MYRKKSFIVFVFTIFIFIGCGGGGSSTTTTGGSSSSNSIVAPALISKSSTSIENGVTVVNVKFDNTGGALTSCSVTPTLPSGLHLASNCSIYGRATANQSSTLYTVTGVNSLGASTATVSIAIIAAAPNLSAISAVLLKNGTVATISQFPNSGSAITSCIVSPSLPSGLTLGNDCSITGTPTVNTASTVYTVTATNSAGSSTASITLEIIASPVNVQGTITYDSVPFVSGGLSGLDYGNITQKSVRGAVVEAINSGGTVIASTVTDSVGAYSMNITQNTTIKIRISAKLFQAKTASLGSWDFQVKDNTSSDALYVMEGTLSSTGTNTTQTRTLNASSGWGGSSYTSTRTAAPFAILDVIYEAIQKVTTAQSTAIFDPLNIFWSINNISSTSKNVTVGQILTSHYDGTSLFILGKENSDTDEYDSVIIGHEWGHYYEAKFSRSDSIGNSHGNGDMLDIRVAFGEGFGNAIGCIINDTAFYLDSSGTRQASTGVFMNLEAGGSTTNAGWYSERSISNILYDIYDSSNDTGDTLSLGFTPIYNLLIGAERNTATFTSLFTFITALKAENPGNDAAIDAIVANEGIASISNVYGTGRSNRTANANPLYVTLNVGASVSIVPNYTATSTTVNNRLGSYNFISFTIPTAGTYTITASGTSGTNLDFYAYKAGSTSSSITSTSTGTSISGTATLSAGIYRMYIVDTNLVTGATFTVTLN